MTIDPNALNHIGGSTALPTPPMSPPHREPHHAAHHHAEPHKAGRHHAGPREAGPREAGPRSAGRHHAAPHESPAHGAAHGPAPAAPALGTIHAKGLGPSFTTLPVLPGAEPPLPAPPKISTLPPAPDKKEPAPTTATQHAAQPPVASQPAADAHQPAAHAMPAPQAIATTQQTTTPQPATPPPASALPPGANQLTLPYDGQETALTAPETAMLRNFVRAAGSTARFRVTAFAAQPAGDTDPSTARRIALSRAQGLGAIIAAAGVPALQIRLITRGNAGGTPPDRVEVVSIPRPPGHSAPTPSP